MLEDYDQRLRPTVLRLQQDSGIIVLVLDLVLLQLPPLSVRGLIREVPNLLTSL